MNRIILAEVKVLFRRSVSFILAFVLTAIGVLTPFQTALATTAEEMIFGGGTGEIQPGTDAADADMYESADDNSITDYPTLQLGDRDEADATAYIVNLQNRLIALGFLKDSADGVYGENTETAIEQFQKLNGLERTGVADPETQRRLFSDMSTLTTPSPDNAIAFGSENVRVQTMLIQWGFLDGTADGVLGKKSEKAISSFKNYIYDLGLMPTPSPAPTPTPVPTLAPGEMPVAMDVPVETPTPEPEEYVADAEIDDTIRIFLEGEESFDVYRQTVQTSDKGAEVKRVQTRLKQLKYLYPDPDGAFGTNTARALMYFQRKHGLSETGVADEATQRALFSSAAQESEEYVFPYKIYVDISDQYVYVFGWDGGSYSIQERKMICSTGKDDTPTPTGTYQAYAQLSGEWYWFKQYQCYAKWAYGIVGGILFHSVTFNKNKKQVGSESNLGRKASHGCVRLKIDDAKWIYDNCPYGTTVVIQE